MASKSACDIPGHGAGKIGALAAIFVSAHGAGVGNWAAVAAVLAEDDSACAVHNSFSENNCRHKATDAALRKTIIALLEAAPFFFGARIFTESTSPQAET